MIEQYFNDKESDKMEFMLSGTVCTDGKLLDDYYILIDGEKIKGVGPLKDAPASFSGPVYTYPKTNPIIPGFIDVHIHGAYGYDVMDATTDALITMAKQLVKEGTTAFLATTMTQSKQAIERALKNAGQYIHSANNKPGQAEVIGIHLEGPFINPNRKGAQPEQHILPPDILQFEQWQKLAQGMIRLVTLAPEMENGIDFVKYLANHHVIASIGHSDADYVKVQEAVQAGASHVTHLFNGMKGLHHREPGTAGASLLFDELTVEIIADGIHVRPDMIDLAVRLKGTDNVVLISDAMRAKDFLMVFQN